MVKRTRIILGIARILDFIALPFTLIAGIWFRSIRKLGLQHMPLSKRALLAIGVLPVRDHYYEPLINPGHLKFPLARPRSLPGIDFNTVEQLELLARFSYQKELLEFPLKKAGELQFYYHNDSFESGDAEFLYCLLRTVKPRKMIEIGSGHSTLISRKAFEKNLAEDSTYACEHICVEPYEQPMLESLGVQLIRRRVEECGIELFKTLAKGDVLFIDSSHVIRPQGDVVFEYLELLPILESGVYVHVHDVFSPRDYLQEWIVDEIKLWNEQYLLEAFLTFNNDYKIIGALNFLKHEYPAEIGDRLPVLRAEMQYREPGSFWLVKK